MKTHTKGPWKFTFENIDPEWAVVTDQYGHIVANVNSESGPDIPPLNAKQMPRDANAQLIAATPDLLESLQKLVGHVLHYATMPHAHSDAHKDAADARAAIAKAIGK